MKQAKQKLGKSGGFTLVEMLIVVAIIAILIAVSIPLISSALEKARHAVDDANRRDAIALGTVKYLTEETSKLFPSSGTNIDGLTPSTDDDGVAIVTYIYEVSDNSQGELKLTGTGVKPKCTALDECDDARKDLSEKATELKVIIRADGKVKTTWDDAYDTTE